MKKIVYTSVVLISLLFVVSCEKDFREIGTGIIPNNAFTTEQVTYDVTITPLNVDAVRADNIAINQLGEYLFGVYKNDDYKTINASFVSQLGFVQPPKTSDVKPASSETEQNRKIDSVITLDKVVLKLPYTVTNIRKSSDKAPKFRLDSLLGDPSIKMPLKVYRNGTFFNTLNPSNPTEGNSYQSDATYIHSELLNQDTNYEFSPNPNDTILIVDRNVSALNGTITGTFKDTIKLQNTTPFIRVPLNTARMKELFWDKFKGSEFSDANAFNNYFRGVIVETDATDGALVPLQLSGNPTAITGRIAAIPSVDFFYTITRYEIKEGATALTRKDTIKSTFSFPINGTKASKYNMSPAQSSTSTKSFPIQGTAGTMARINILNGNELSDLRSQKILINDASLVFNIDADRDTTKVPLRLLVYKEGTGNKAGEHIIDSYRESSLFGGLLDRVGGKPDKYQIRITKHVSDLVRGVSTDNTPLVLKVYNVPTDASVVNRNVNTVVQTYNWNPRGVSLLNNSSVNGEKKAKLIISYSKEKESN